MKMRNGLGWALAAGMVLSGAALAEDRALIIGVGNYSNSRANLPGIDLDVNMAQQMARKLGYTAPQIQTLTNNQATHRNIMAALEGIARDTRASDKVLIYFSGHGEQVKDINGDEEDGCDEALVPYDLDNPVIDDELATVLNTVPARQVLMLVDSCFSATVTKSVSSLPKTAKFIKSATDCNVARNKGSRSVGTGELGLVRRSTVSNPNPRTGVIEFTAASDNEYAQASSEGSLFTLALYSQVMSGQPTSFERMRQVAADYIFQNSDKPSVPNLLGPADWLTRSLFDFGRLDTAAPRNDTDGVTINGATQVSEAFRSILQGKSSSLDLSATKSVYKLDEDIAFSVTTPISGYLNILEYNPDNTVTVLYPNKYQKSNLIPALSSVSLPGGVFEFFAAPPTGKSQILALVTSEPLNLFNEKLAGQLDPSGFRTLVDPNAFAAFGGLLNAKSVGTRLSSKNQQYAAALLNLEVVR